MDVSYTANIPTKETTMTTTTFAQRLSILAVHMERHTNLAAPTINAYTFLPICADLGLQVDSGEPALLVRWAATLRGEITWIVQDFSENDGPSAWHVHAKGRIGIITVDVWQGIGNQFGDTAEAIQAAYTALVGTALVGAR